MGKKIGAGAVAGLIGGLVFDVLLGVWPTSTAVGGRISMIAFAARVIHVRHAWIGWVVYLVYAIVIGGVFAWLLRGEPPGEGSAALWGALYGFGWWLVAGLVVAPGLLGHPPFTASAVEAMWGTAGPLLVGHLVYGVILGAVFDRLTNTRGKPWRPRAMGGADRRAA